MTSSGPQRSGSAGESSLRRDGVTLKVPAPGDAARGHEGSERRKIAREPEDANAWNASEMEALIVNAFLIP